MYKRSIVLLQDQQHAHIVRTVLDDRKKEYERDLRLLSDFESVRSDVRTNRSTAGLRKHLGEFIAKYGYPFLLVTDYRPDLGLPPEQDPDRLALFRALLVSFALLASNGPHKHKTLNIICLASPEDTDQLESAVTDPALCFELLRLRDERTQQILKPYLDDPELFRRVFNVRVLPYPAGAAVHDGIRKLGEIVTAIEQRLLSGSAAPAAGTAAAEGLIKKNLAPASAVFRATPEKIVVNGEVRTITPAEQSRWVEAVLYIEGGLTSEHLPKVQQNILLTLAAVPKVRPMKKDAALILFIPDTSVIDESFAMKFGMFVSNTLARQSKVALRLEKVNLEKVTKSAGFIAIRELIKQPA
jgi:hypothetical protein